MQFLDRFGGPVRERLMAAGRTRRIDAGSLLIRRGERGGDIYLIETGSFEVVDTRSSPEVVLNVVGPGAVVGEMAFLDAAPRTADVRATTPSLVRVWEYESLNRVLEAEPDFAAVFYRAMADTGVERMRNLSTSAVVGGLGPRPGAAQGPVVDQAHAIAMRIQSRWVDADVRLRRDPTDDAAAEDVRAGFALLLQEATSWLRSFGDAEEAALAGAALCRELRPYLSRSEAVQLSLDPPAGRTGHPRQLAHVLLGEARGDGVLGHVIDDCVLSLPTAAALRGRTRRATEAVVAELPADRPARILLVNATCGALLAAMSQHLARAGADVLALDGSREALAFLDAGLPSHPATLKLKLVQQDLADLVLGRSDAAFGAQDVVVLDALLDYLPDRLAAGLLSWTARHLGPDGAAVITGLAPSPDAALFDHVLGWPMVRRSGKELRALAEACGLRAAPVPRGSGDRDPGVVYLLRPGGP